jgi:hypothetical protein
MKTKKSVVVKYIVLLGALAVTLSACHSAKPVEDNPEVLLAPTVKGGKSQPIPVPPPPAPLVLENTAPENISTANLPPWASNTIRFEAGAAYPENATSRVQGMALARRLAHDQIVQGLALQIGELAAPGGGTVNDVLKVQPELAQNVEQAIRKGIVYTPQPDDGGPQYHESGTLQLTSVAAILFGQNK